MSQVLLRFLVSPCRVNLAWLPAVMCLAGFTFSFLYKYPQLTFDPFTQYGQSQIGIIGDWYPPITVTMMQLLPYTVWRLCSIGILWFGIFMCIHFKSFWNSKRPVWQFFIIVLLFIWLSVDVFFICRCFSKDLIFIGSYLSAVGLLLNMPKRTRTKIIVGIIVLFFLYCGTAFRHNALPALYPLLCWLVWCFVNPPINKRPYTKLSVILSISVILWGGYIALNHYISYTAIKTVRLYPLSETFYNDIWHLNAMTQKYVVPPNGFGNNFSTFDETQFRNSFDPNHLYWRTCFKKNNDVLPKETRLTMDRSTAIIYDGENTDKMEVLTSLKPILKLLDGPPEDIFLIPLSALKTYPDDYRNLRNAWIQRILSDPFAYLKFKSRFYLKLFRDNYLWFMRLNALCVLPITMLLVTAGFFSSRRMSDEQFPMWMLSLSALVYILPLFFCMPSTVLRYLYWFYAASFINIAYFLAHSPLFAAILQTVQQYLEQKIQKE